MNSCCIISDSRYVWSTHCFVVVVIWHLNFKLNIVSTPISYVRIHIYFKYIVDVLHNYKVFFLNTQNTLQTHPMKIKYEEKTQVDFGLRVQIVNKYRCFFFFKISRSFCYMLLKSFGFIFSIFLKSLFFFFIRECIRCREIGFFF